MIVGNNVLSRPKSKYKISQGVRTCNENAETQVILYPSYMHEDNAIFTEKGQETLAVELLFKWFEYVLSLPYRPVDNDTFLVLLSPIIRG